MKRLLLAVMLFCPSFTHAQSISIHAIGGQSPDNWHGQAELTSFAVEVDRPLSPRTEVGLLIAPMNLWQPKSWFGDQFGDGNETVRALHGALLVRRHFNRDSARIHPYGELATGPMWAEKRVPASTSRFNFITSAGAGVTLWPQRRVSLVVGYRFQHISNGGYSPRNPGLNVSSVVLGARLKRR